MASRIPSAWGHRDVRSSGTCCCTRAREVTGPLPPLQARNSQEQEGSGGEDVRLLLRNTQKHAAVLGQVPSGVFGGVGEGMGVKCAKPSENGPGNGRWELRSVGPPGCTEKGCATGERRTQNRRVWSSALTEPCPAAGAGGAGVGRPRGGRQAPGRGCLRGAEPPAKPRAPPTAPRTFRSCSEEQKNNSLSIPRMVFEQTAGTAASPCRSQGESAVVQGENTFDEGPSTRG